MILLESRHIGPFINRSIPLIGANLVRPSRVDREGGSPRYTSFLHGLTRSSEWLPQSLRRSGGQISLWQICGRNKWNVTVTYGNGCQQMQKPSILLVAATRFK